MRYSWHDIASGQASVDSWNRAAEKMQNIKNKIISIAGVPMYRVAQEKNYQRAERIARHFFSTFHHVSELTEFLACFSEGQLDKIERKLR